MVNLELNRENFLKEFDVKKVILNVQSKDKKIEIKYELLIVDDSIIIHYRLFFKSLFLKHITTRSHQNPKYSKNKNSMSILDLRKNILNICGIEHQFGETKIVRNKPKHEVNDIALLRKISNYFNSHNCCNIVTFRGIEYIINGYNPVGLPKKNTSFIYIDYENKLEPYGIFLESLNNTKHFSKSKYLINEPKNEKFFIGKNFDWLYEYTENHSIDFVDWLNNFTNLKGYYDDLISKTQDWKQIVESIKSEVKKIKMKYLKLEKTIDEERKRFVQSIKAEKKSNSHFYNIYFDIKNKENDFENAHIKPVYLIKKEYLNTGDENKISEISDVNNFLPLPPTVHSEYDKHYFYWNQNGELIEINSNKITIDEVDKFRRINPSILNKQRRNFLYEYYKKVIEPDLAKKI